MNPAAREYAFPTGRAPDHSGGARLLTSRLRVCTSASQAHSPHRTCTGSFRWGEATDEPTASMHLRLTSTFAPPDVHRTIQVGRGY